MPAHPKAKPNFRNLFWYPFKMTMITALRTFPFIGKRFSWGYHNKIHPEVMDEPSSVRSSNSKWNTPSKHEYTADREGFGPNAYYLETSNNSLSLRASGRHGALVIRSRSV